MKIGVVGCGIISDIYQTNMKERFADTEVVACCAAHMESARKSAAKYGLKACTYEEMLAMPEIEMIVVLTPAPTHYTLIRQALEAGKHVYTEKSLTISLPDAKELLKLADEKNLYLGSAPDTFLGAALQTVRKAVDEGRIGQVTSFFVSATRNLDYIAGIHKFLCMPGGGVGFDYGVYYLTALVSILGPVKSVQALVRNLRPKRTNIAEGHPDFGKEFDSPNEDQIMAVLEFENGVVGTFSLNGDTVTPDLADFTLYGTKGALRLTDPNGFGGDVLFVEDPLDWVEPKVSVLSDDFLFAENSRGIGPEEMICAIRENRRNRASKEMAFHVLDILCCMVESSEKRMAVEVTSTCERPAPLTREEEEKFIRS